MGFGYPQISQEKSNPLGFHTGSPVSMDRELSWLNRLFRAALLNQPLSQGRLLPVSNHPADNVPAVYVDYDIQVKVVPFGGSLELGYITGPDLILACCQQFRFAVSRPLNLFTAFCDASML